MSTRNKHLWIVMTVGTVATLVPLLGHAEARTTKPTSMFRDVSLHEDGTLDGVFVDRKGAPIRGAKVVLRQQSKLIAVTMTNNQGRFQIRQLRGGVYEIAANQGVATFRLWTAKTAPPAARSGAVLVANHIGPKSPSAMALVRGQDGAPTLLFNPNSTGAQFLQLATPALSISGSVLTISETNKIEDQVRQILDASP